MKTAQSPIDQETVQDNLSQDINQFQHLAQQVVEPLAQYLQQVIQPGNTLPVLPPISPQEMLDRWPGTFQEGPSTTLREFVEQVIRDSNHLHHPRYIGHQVATTLPVAALLELVSGVMNNSSAVYEMGPANTIMEKRVIQWMGQALGFGPMCDGVLTSGGSLGNLTGLLAARQAKTGDDYWDKGHQDGKYYAVMVSEKAHYSVKRALQILGWGHDSAILLPVDEKNRIRPECLLPALNQARTNGQQVIAVVGSACNTSTGTFDPLEPIADFCEEYNLWFHVDGAHGAPTVLSSKYRGLTHGIDRADSVVWDLHKMMQIPALNTAVLFRDGQRSYDTFRQRAEYLLKDSEGEESFDICERTLECTKRMKGMIAYGALMIKGTRYFSDYVTSTYDLARVFARLIQENPRFDLAMEPESNIICFRYIPTSPAVDIDRLQLTIRQRLLESGAFYLVKTQLKDNFYLRCTLMNPLTTPEDLSALLDQICVIGDQVSGQG